MERLKHMNCGLIRLNCGLTRMNSGASQFSRMVLLKWMQQPAVHLSDRIEERKSP